MAYTSINFKTKKEIKDALSSGQHISVFNPGIGEAPTNGNVYLEGPWYPEPHKWYATGQVVDGKLVSVK